jgi:hypothetical protein
LIVLNDLEKEQSKGVNRKKKERARTKSLLCKTFFSVSKQTKNIYSDQYQVIVQIEF